MPQQFNHLDITCFSHTSCKYPYNVLPIHPSVGNKTTQKCLFRKVNTQMQHYHEKCRWENSLQFAKNNNISFLYFFQICNLQCPGTQLLKESKKLNQSSSYWVCQVIENSNWKQFLQQNMRVMCLHAR